MIKRIGLAAVLLLTTSAVAQARCERAALSMEDAQAVLCDFRDDPDVSRLIGEVSRSKKVIEISPLEPIIMIERREDGSPRSIEQYMVRIKTK